MVIDSVYHAVAARLRKLIEGEEEFYAPSSPNALTSHGLGSGSNGETLSQLMCANTTGNGWVPRSCPMPGWMTCSKCYLVKYCSEQCQILHRAKHRADCKHPLLKAEWQPRWVGEKRAPVFASKQERLANSMPRHEGSYLGGTIPAFDCLQVDYNEGSGATKSDFKLCFAASGDIRNLVQTVNGLPPDYHGKCDILLNDIDSVIVNRNLVTLFALLSPGPTLEEAAEIATHLMYSSALPAATAIYLERCIQVIYENSDGEGEMTYQTCLNTRGEGKLYSTQTVMGMKRPMEMFFSSYNLPTALKSMRSIVLNPARIDYRDRYFAGLKPAHRLSALRFLESGVLAPFSLNIGHFTKPNRLLFSAQGDWLESESVNPLYGWDISAAQTSGRRHGVDSSDINGCLFFHVKDELQEFATRIRDFEINIHLTQFDARVLSKAIPIGVLDPFGAACFDRVETANMADFVGIQQVLEDWGPLLKRNKHSSLLMYSTNWHTRQLNATARSNPRALESLMDKCHNVPALGSKLKRVFAQGMQSPALFRLIGSLDAFYDHETHFQEYLREQHANETAAALGLQLRISHRIHPKRFGISLSAPQQKLPDLSKSEFYDLFTIGGAEFPVRFMEYGTVDE